MTRYIYRGWASSNFSNALFLTTTGIVYKLHVAYTYIYVLSCSKPPHNDSTHTLLGGDPALKEDTVPMICSLSSKLAKMMVFLLALVAIRMPLGRVCSWFRRSICTTSRSGITTHTTPTNCVQYIEMSQWIILSMCTWSNVCVNYMHYVGIDHCVSYNPYVSIHPSNPLATVQLSVYVPCWRNICSLVSSRACPGWVLLRRGSTWCTHSSHPAPQSQAVEKWICSEYRSSECKVQRIV